MSHPVKVAFLVLAATFVGLKEVKCDRILKSERTTYWGEWGPWEWCPEDEFAVGFEIRVEAYGGILDDTGLNAIRLNCDNRTDPWKSKGQQTVIESSSMTWGTWRGYNKCPYGYIFGFQLQVQPPQPKCKDDTAAGDLNVYCGSIDSQTVLNGRGEGFTNSKWQNPRLCPHGYAICGMRTQVEKYQGWEEPNNRCVNVDDSALNNVDMYCCYLGLYLAGGVTEKPDKRPTN